MGAVLITMGLSEFEMEARNLARLILKLYSIFSFEEILYVPNKIILASQV
jgi:hypothetical protein